MIRTETSTNWRQLLMRIYVNERYFKMIPALTLVEIMEEMGSVGVAISSHPNQRKLFLFPMHS